MREQKNRRRDTIRNTIRTNLKKNEQKMPRQIKREEEWYYYGDGHDDVDAYDEHDNDNYAEKNERMKESRYR